MSEAESIAVLGAKIERLEALLANQNALLLRVLANQEEDRVRSQPQEEQRTAQEKSVLVELLPLLASRIGDGCVFTAAGLLRSIDDELRAVLPEKLRSARSLGRLLARWEGRSVKYHVIRRQQCGGRDSEGAVWCVVSVFADNESQKHIAEVAN